MCPFLSSFFIFVLALFEFNKLSHAFHPFRFSSIDIHLKSIKLGVCPIDYGNNRDLCNKSLTPILSTVKSDYEYFEDNCACDWKCSAYNDCCADILDKEEAQVYHHRNWSCVNFPSVHQDQLFYALQSCASDWIQTDIKSLCTNEPNSLIQLIPAFSNRTGILYRNIFCLVCNYESSIDIHQWTLSLICDQMGVKIEQVRKYFVSQYFDPRGMVWSFEHNFVPYKCYPVINEFSNYEAIINNFNGRPCKQAVNTCPTSFNDQIIKAFCHSHTFYLYSKTREQIFRNLYCAMCNNIDLSTLDCDLSSRASSQSLNLFHSSLSVLFNYQNFVSTCPLGSGKFEIFDPSRNKCIPFFCGKLYKFNMKTLKCEKIESNFTGLISDCIKEFIPENEYVILNNYSVLLKKSNRLMNDASYEHYKWLNKITGATLDGILICYDYHSPYAVPFVYDAYQEIVSLITLGISIACLIFHLLVHSLVPKLRNLHAKILMGLSTSLLLASIAFLFGSKIRPTDDEKVIYHERGSWLCIMIAIIIHYAYLASFAWMNIMSFDMLRCVRLQNSFKRFNGSSKTFRKYSLYSWLFPAIIVGIACSFDLSSLDSNFKPLYGHRICWISQKQALLTFFVGPVFLIIVVNILLFALTAFFILQIQNGTKKFKDSNKNNDAVKFNLFFKLALVMGLTWVFGIIAAFSALNFFWYFFIILNGSQGAFIFLSYTCKRKVYNHLKHEILMKLNLSRKNERLNQTTIRPISEVTNALSVISMNPSHSNVSKNNG